MGFDAALQSNEPELVKRRIFLTLERSRDIAMRNLFRKVYLAAGYEDLKEGQTEKDRIRKSRIPLLHFATALRMGIAGEGGGQYIEDEEVECLLANLIYKVGGFFLGSSTVTDLQSHLTFHYCCMFHGS